MDRRCWRPSPRSPSSTRSSAPGRGPSLGVRSGPFLGWAPAGAVLTDLDHVPLHLWDVGAITPGGRPLTHSPAFAALLALGAAATGKARLPLLGLAGGVVLHLARDLGSGGGVPALWPLSDGDVRVPYAAYLAALAVLAGIAAATAARRPSPSGDARAQRG